MLSGGVNIRIVILDTRCNIQNRIKTKRTRMKVEQNSELQVPVLKTDKIYLRTARLSDFWH